MMNVRTIKVALYVISLVWLCTSLLSHSYCSTEYANEATCRPTTKEADLCYHVFLNLGANIGVHCRFLFEPDKYPNATISKNIFHSQYGLTRDNRDICCFEFEANPLHYKSLQEKSHAYSKVGWRFNVKKFGVGDKNGLKTFFHQADAEYNEWGYTEMMTTMQTSSENVKVLRIATWINDNVIERKLPRRPFGNYSSGPKIVMKIDVEGSEYLILPDLFSEGVLCKLNLSPFTEYWSHHNTGHTTIIKSLDYLVKCQSDVFLCDAYNNLSVRVSL
jgi:Methyltransferase FkbM domain